MNFVAGTVILGVIASVGEMIFNLISGRKVD